MLSTQHLYTNTSVKAVKDRRNVVVGSKGDQFLHPIAVSTLKMKASK